jgi:bifunctional non-homologous end joining protein LigD
MATASMARTPLAAYRRKRDFKLTPEPRDRGAAARGDAHTFVVHLHHARARHFDLRLQVGDVLRSWAVPKGPSLDPHNKRLAVEVEDHPLAYRRFEGDIPQGQYGAGTVWIWDRGTWTPQGDPRKGLRDGHLRFTLRGERLKGDWSLIRTRIKGRQPEWLLIKVQDAAARSGDEADDVPLSRWRSTRARSRSRNRPAAHGARARPRSGAASQRPPERIGLQLARLVDAAPEGNGWLHEVKFDGYRVLIWRAGAAIRITSRGSQDWTQKLPATARAVAQLPCQSCVLDAELVALDQDGRSSFSRLQQCFGEEHGEARLRTMVFDLLYLDGRDLRALPQLARKKSLAQLLKRVRAPLMLTSFTVGHGTQAARAACEQGLEGIISKAAAAAYEDGRGGAWLKVKCVQSDEFAIVGYTTGQGAREELGSLLLATPAGSSTWRYMGRVGTGFNARTVADLLRRMRTRSEPVRLENPPARAQLRGARPKWVTPTLVVEVEFRGYTGDGLLRQASLKGVRPDRGVGSLRPGRRDKASVEAGM